jgi:hypothetical protein
MNNEGFAFNVKDEKDSTHKKRHSPHKKRTKHTKKKFLKQNIKKKFFCVLCSYLFFLTGSPLITFFLCARFYKKIKY